MNPLYRNDKPGSFPASWYVDTADIPETRPELRGAARADVCVIGAGFTGLRAALELAERGFKVIVLDAHRVGFGASGRNGGQVSSGFNWGQKELTAKMGDGPARAVWDLAEAAKTDLKSLAIKHAPDARFTPGVAEGGYNDKEVRHLHQETDFLAQHYGYDQMVPLDRIGFQDIVRSPFYAGGWLDMGGGHIHPLRYVLGLARAAIAAGVTIHEMSEVHNVTHTAPAKVQTGRGHVMADHVVFAGNGYLPHLNGKIAARVMPVNSFICATEPLGDRAGDVLSRDIAVADSKFVVNYFRLSEDKRLLFGGRANYGLGFPTDMQTALRKRFETMFPQIKGVTISHAWGGTLGITMTRLPAVQQVTPNMWSAAGYSGQGVALSGFCGQIIAMAIAGQADSFDAMRALPVPNFPGSAMMRAPLLTLAMTWYGLRDRLGI